MFGLSSEMYLSFLIRKKPGEHQEVKYLFAEERPDWLMCSPDVEVSHVQRQPGLRAADFHPRLPSSGAGGLLPLPSPPRGSAVHVVCGKSAAAAATADRTQELTPKTRWPWKRLHLEGGGESRGDRALVPTERKLPFLGSRTFCHHPQPAPFLFPLCHPTRPPLHLDISLLYVPVKQATHSFLLGLESVANWDQYFPVP